MTKRRSIKSLLLRRSDDNKPMPLIIDNSKSCISCHDPEVVSVAFDQEWTIFFCRSCQSEWWEKLSCSK